MDKDLYQMLGVSPDADESEIRSAHRALARKYHPDAGEGSSDERFREIQRAYDVLGDAARRAEYDRGRKDREACSPRLPSSAWPFFERRSPQATHVDLRYLSRRRPAERIEFASAPRPARAEADPWDALLAFLLGDLY